VARGERGRPGARVRRSSTACSLCTASLRWYIRCMVKGILNRQKKYVTVEVSTDADGAITPRAVLWGDGRRFEIDEVLDARTAASLKVGGAGLRFTVRIGDAVTYLFYENPRWFCEAKRRGEL